ncbi:MAG: stage 0 sporulation family protein [Candidatus Firestonebacteria bacterium]|nr:stage 0 sporulation family protein [Candidatus Firestonebacteria bacterium]
MYEVIGIKFKDTCKIYYFNSEGLELQPGDKCVVETEEGLAFGEVATEIKMVPENQFGKPLRKVVRKATRVDFSQIARNEEKVRSATEICLNKIKDRELSIKLVGVHYSFDGRKAIFYFTAEGRVDFRELVKDLAHILKVRIELRQIGVRDEAKMLGGLGPCGREVCCSNFLEDFEPVTIKMAKEQNLILNPAKTSGLCGRLMCCLMYEHEFYRDAMKKYPKLGSKITIQGCTGKIIDINVFLEKVVVEQEDGKRLSLQLSEIKSGHNLKNIKEDKKEEKNQ